MKKIKKEVVYVETEDFPYKTGYSLGTIYNIEDNKYKLYNFGYCPNLNLYYYNNNVHVPRKLKKAINSFETNDLNSSLLEELYGFISMNEYNRLIDDFNDDKADNIKMFIKKM